MKTLTYRPDVDGLRAVAVTGVVIFHAWPGLLRGGFTGVDVFFVVSGFLITSLITTELEAGTFSFGQFYARRLKRLFPALLVVLAACGALGWFVLFGNELQQLAKHTAFAAAFSANFAFWAEAGYFDVASELKVLLHLWSLGVEEQFYLLWPLALFFLRRHVRLLIPALAIASFAWSVICTHLSPAHAFFLPDTRFWELLIGCGLSFLSSRLGFTGARANGASVAGLLLIAAGFVWITRSGFPGVWALLPTLGAALIIAAGPGAWLNRRVLSNSVAVGLGKLSYPLYLWHWPALVYARILGSTIPTAVIVAAAVLASWLTYVAIERPIRFGTRVPHPVRWLAVAMACMLAAGVVVNQLRGVPGRIKGGLSAELQQDLLFDVPKRMECSAPLLAEPKLKYCGKTTDAPVAAVYGDSHGDTLYEGIANVDADRGWILLANPSCPPILDVDVFSDTSECQERQRKAFDYLMAHEEIRTVVFVFYGNYAADQDVAADHLRYRNGPSHIRMASPAHPGLSKAELLKLGLEASIGPLIKAGRKVALVTDVPELRFWPQDCIPRVDAEKPPECTQDAAVVRQRQAQERQIIAELSAEFPALRVFDTGPLFCDDHVCEARRGRMLLYRDSNHLSLRGSSYVARALLKWL